MLRGSAPIALALIASCQPTTGDLPWDASIDATPAPWLAGHRFRKEVAVKHAGTAALGDFPLAIIRREDADLAAHARPLGTDLVVTSTDGVTQLDHELAYYDAATGALELWVRVPTLEVGTTRLYLYYGGEAVAAAADRVWSPRHAGVWHLSDAEVIARDSTVARYSLSSLSPALEPGRVTGVAGLARSFDGVDDQLEIPDPADGSLDFGTRSFSYSLWFRQIAVVDEYDVAFYKGGTSATRQGYAFLLGRNDWGAKVHDGTRFYDAVFGNEPQFRDRWVHLVAVLDRTAAQFRAYTDGVLADEVGLPVLDSLSTAEPFGVGTTRSPLFRGHVDEVRIYREVVSADWIAAEHANLAKPDFVTIGAHHAR